MQVYMSASRGFVGSGANIARTASASNPTLEPSISTAFELGMKSDLFDNSVRLNGAIFWQETEDLQTTSLVPGTVLTQSFNAGTVTVTGMESSITWSATDMLTLDASVSYLDSEMSDLLQPCYLGQTIAQGCNLDVNGNVTTVASSARQQDIDGQPIIQAPEWAYTLKGRLDIPTGDMPFDMYTALAYTWQDDIQYSLTYDPLTEEDARGLLDATLALEDRAGAWKLTLFGKNITDEYFNSARSAGGGYASQGRLLTRTSREAQAYWGVKFRYNF
jgi:iron complex outermembrane receptor protein